MTTCRLLTIWCQAHLLIVAVSVSVAVAIAVAIAVVYIENLIFSWLQEQLEQLEQLRTLYNQDLLRQVCTNEHSELVDTGKAWQCLEYFCPNSPVSHTHTHTYTHTHTHTVYHDVMTTYRLLTIWCQAHYGLLVESMIPSIKLGSRYVLWLMTLDNIFIPGTKLV